MRTMKALAFATAAAAMIPFAGMAQETMPDDPTTTTPPPAASSPTDDPAMENSTDTTMGQDSSMDEPAVITAQEDGQVLSDSYIGASVVASSAEGTESVGKVSNLLLGEDEKIVGVVVDVGGFLGVGAKRVGLSWAALTEEMADGATILRTSLTREELEEAPEFMTLEAQQLESDRQMMDQGSAPASPTLQ